jgi:aminomethyltransferase
MLKHTPFYEKHVKHGGQLVEFHGWHLSMQFSGIPDEHNTVRQSVGMFDVSHMGNLRFGGEGAQDFLNQTLTNRYDNIRDFQCKYAHILREDGTIIDDNIVAKIGEEEFFCVPNATMIDTDLKWYEDHAPEGVKFENLSHWGILAVQGPKAEATVQKITDYDLASLRFFRCGFIKLAGNEHENLVWRTGYTGEDGFELMLPPEDCSKIWDAVFEAGQEFGIKPIGLGARDTLRLEKGFLLSGQDFDGEDSGPRTSVETYESGKFALNMNHEFRGKEVLEKQMEEDSYQRLIGLNTGRKGIPREGCEVLHDGKVISKVTSGSYIPATKEGIAMAYLPKELAVPGTEMAIKVRTRDVPAGVFSFRG